MNTKAKKCMNNSKVDTFFNKENQNKDILDIRECRKDFNESKDIKKINKSEEKLMKAYEKENKKIIKKMSNCETEEERRKILQDFFKNYMDKIHTPKMNKLQEQRTKLEENFCKKNYDGVSDNTINELISIHEEDLKCYKNIKTENKVDKNFINSMISSKKNIIKDLKNRKISGYIY
tara:strand:+ start:47 stop:577 length:531 start_codon:yes stop_codon:yes gene_type:complete